MMVHFGQSMDCGFDIIGYDMINSLHSLDFVSQIFRIGQKYT